MVGEGVVVVVVGATDVVVVVVVAVGAVVGVVVGVVVEVVVDVVDVVAAGLHCANSVKPAV